MARAFRRELLEAELLPCELEVLRSTTAALGRPLRTWPRIPWLRQLAETLAVENRTSRLQGEGPRRPALERACRELGVPLARHRRRLQRARSAAFDPDRE